MTIQDIIQVDVRNSCLVTGILGPFDLTEAEERIMKQLTNYTGANQAGLFAIQQSDHIDTRILAAGGSASHTIPAEARFVIFTSAINGVDSTGDFWVKVDGVAAVPIGDIIDGSSSEYKPVVRFIGKSTTIGLKSATGAIVGMAFYK